MTDWNRDGRIDAADRAMEYAAYNAIMNGDRAHRSAPPRSRTTGRGSRLVWAAVAIVAAAIVGILHALAR